MELSDPDLKMTKGAKIQLLRCLSTFTDVFFPALLPKKIHWVEQKTMSYNFSESGIQ